MPCGTLVVGLGGPTYAAGGSYFLGNDSEEEFKPKNSSKQQKTGSFSVEPYYCLWRKIDGQPITESSALNSIFQQVNED